MVELPAPVVQEVLVELPVVPVVPEVPPAVVVAPEVAVPPFPFAMSVPWWWWWWWSAVVVVVLVELPAPVVPVVVVPVVLVVPAAPVVPVVPPAVVVVPEVAVPPVPFAMFGFAVTGVVPCASPWTEVAVDTVVAVPT